MLVASRIALEFADKALVLDRGAAVFSGPSHDLLAHPARLAALMGVAARDGARRTER